MRERVETTADIYPKHLAVEYARRLMTARAAVSLISPRAKLVMGMGVAQPPALLAALADRAVANSLECVEIYYLLSTSIAQQTVLKHELREWLRPISLFHGAIERKLDDEAAHKGAAPVDFIPTAFSQSPRILAERIRPDVLVTTVSAMDHRGYFSLGTNVDYAAPLSRSVSQIILEVNPDMPWTFGDSMIHISDVSAIVENAAPLLEVPNAHVRPNDVEIGRIVAALVEDGDCLQVGIGAVPQAVCDALCDHRHLGIHSELVTPALAELMRAGIADNSRKTLHPGKSIFTFGMGDTAFYKFLDRNPLLEAHAVNYVNDPAIIAQNAKMVSVNATLQVDLTGACNSEAIEGRQYSAAGGQLDFVRGAYAAAGGRSVLACHSTAANGTVSRIVPRLNGPATSPRNDTHIVVTEFGWADLKGLTVKQRALALINLAHPKFREDLSRAAYQVFRAET